MTKTSVSILSVRTQLISHSRSSAKVPTSTVKAKPFSDARSQQERAVCASTHFRSQRGAGNFKELRCDMWVQEALAVDYLVWHVRTRIFFLSNEPVADLTSTPILVSPTRHR